MKNAGGQNGVGLALKQDLGEVLEGAGAAAGDHRHAHGFADAPRDHQVKTGLRAVGVDAVQNDFTRAQPNRATGPLDGIEAGGSPSAVREHLPALSLDAPGVEGDDDALAAELFRPGANEVRRGQRRRIDADLVGAGAEHGLHVLDGADAAADRKRHKAFFGDALDDIDHGLSCVRTGGDIEKNHFVGALLVVAKGQLNGLADVAQFARLGFAEADAAGDLAVVDVQAGNDAFGEHAGDGRIPDWVTRNKRVWALGSEQAVDGNSQHA